MHGLFKMHLKDSDGFKDRVDNFSPTVKVTERLWYLANVLLRGICFVSDPSEQERVWNLSCFWEKWSSFLFLHEHWPLVSTLASLNLQLGCFPDAGNLSSPALVLSYLAQQALAAFQSIAPIFLHWIGYHQVQFWRKATLWYTTHK